MRDNQQSRVYSAEDKVRKRVDTAARGDGQIELLGSRIMLPVERKFGSLEAIRVYVEWMQDQSWWTYGSLRVRRRQGSKAAHYGHGFIAIHDAELTSRTWQMRELIVLHEVAHHLSLKSDVQAHGPEFCGALLFLLETMIGPEFAWLLRVSFDEYNCKVSVHTPLCGV